MKRRCPGWLGWLVASAGCGPEPASTVDSTSGSAAETAVETSLGTSGGSTSTTSAGTTTGATSSTSSDSSSSTAGETSSTGEPEPPSVCDPQPQDFVASVSIDHDPDRFPPDYLFVDAACTVTEVTDVDSVRRVELLCDEGGALEQHVVQIAADPPVVVPIATGDLVGLRAATFQPIDTPGAYEHVALRDEAGDLLAAMYGAFFGPDDVDVASWVAPFTFALVTDVCEVEPFEPPGGDFISPPCDNQEQRIAFDFTLDARTVRALDRTMVDTAPFDVRVPYALMLYPQALDPYADCGQVMYPRGRFVVLRAQ